MKPLHIRDLCSRNSRGDKLPARRGVCAAGFSLLEMLIVITIIMILAGIAIGRYEKSGYRMFGRLHRYYDDGGDALRFDKPLVSRRRAAGSKRAA